MSPEFPDSRQTVRRCLPELLKSTFNKVKHVIKAIRTNKVKQVIGGDLDLITATLSLCCTYFP